MCGIVAFVDNEKPQLKDTLIKKMKDRIIHRGPDDEGQYVDDNVALGFRRLSFVDVKSGNQPIFNEDQSKLIEFNGEIYNFEELRGELIEKGHTFTTHADTEVILHGYEEWGKDVLQKLRGMFAFIIWDTKTKEMFGARDHFGIKPLYYAQMNGTFFVGSEIKAFLDHPNFEIELNKRALKSYMTFQYNVTQETFFKGVYRLPEAHYFTYKDGKFAMEQYWDEDFDPTNESFDQAVDNIDNVVKNSVKAHTFADKGIKVGSFLSAGVDSSLVTALMRPNNTFSIGFDSGYDETKQARELAAKLDLKNTDKLLTDEEAFKTFPLIQYYLDEPDSNPSVVPLYFLNKLAKDNGYKALLSGEGADELFAGYTAYGFNTKVKFIRWVTEQLKKLPKDQRYKLGKWLEGKHFHGSEHLYRNLAPARDTFIGQAYIFSPAEANEYLKPEYQDGPSITDLLKPLYDKCDEKKPEMNEVAKKQYVDLHRFMPGDICLKADKMSMANSVEIRVPLLDKEVMKVAETTPTKYLFNDKGTKWAFRMAANRHLPEEWATRPKLGFPTPVREWLREEKYYKEVRNLFAQDFVKEFFDQDKLLQLADDNFAGKVDGRRKIWTVYTFLVWYKLYFIDNFKLDESNIDKAKVSAEA
ncbi:MAG: asparagine synthase (glutamine-hydrolyzing) [Limosilactobacillus oris]|jgi:asparagine synthase (glutamine-hydrolysing)|uniref:asparagine synthase (glutamine-hydrolyzing) n=1 Tax=Limosilactobacillus oris TaxID=1632 RepID=UPI00242F4EFA|nr:asparagine synthase (glutamine-hydrolyzing) [Limosilactobacillus oris]MCH3910676.1 asparagine synthase (glutamine-hydrolyzing) [Limosilactobacillus oris]MCH3937928.1 asparagine synthase (glutamine-hydrolyzing) [Limosilactobacillus oris]MCI1979924.1 asparagine synthase (glutamine-hydrolyzing) [Limosilactobacillus oris]